MFGGFGRPQPSSAEKIAAAEAEMDLVTDMFNKYFLHLSIGIILI
jgi:import inner membrane translocase subunit TIM10